MGATWEEIGMLEPASYTLSARIDRPPSADVDVWLESATSPSTIDLLGRESRPRCRRNRGREICVTNVDFYQPELEGWRPIARKISREAAVIRMRLGVWPIGGTQG
jgi:hypothetical protein